MFDILIKNGYVVTMDADKRMLRMNIYIKDGKIVGFANEELEAKRVIDASSCVVLPGLINTHTHLYQSLIDGIGYDMHFEPWNWRFLFPIVSKMTAKNSYQSAALASLQMIESGTTTICDHWYMHTDFNNIREATKALIESGLRGNMIYGLLDKGFAGESLDKDQMTMIHSKEDLIKDFYDYHKNYHNKNNISVGIGIGSTPDASLDLLKRSKQIADELSINMCTHVAGWQDVLAYTYKNYGMRDVEFYYKNNLTGSNSMFIHTVWLTPDEIKMMAETHTSSIHCPAANSQLGYGIAPVAEMLSQKVNVGLGTDGGASYTYDMFEMMRLTAYLQKQKHMSADVFTAEQALEMATIGGARVLNLDKEIGSIEIGKFADIIILDFDSPHLILENRVVPKIVYSASARDVKTTIVNGKVLMDNFKIESIDKQEVMKKSKQAQKELLANAGVETSRLINAEWPKSGAYWKL